MKDGDGLRNVTSLGLAQLLGQSPRHADHRCDPALVAAVPGHRRADDQLGLYIHRRLRVVALLGLLIAHWGPHIWLSTTTITVSH